MKKTKDLLFYVITIGGFGLLMYYILTQGKHLQTGGIVEKNGSGSALGDFISTYKHNLAHPLAILLLQIITIIIVARIFAFICKKIRQPSVIGEIAAGIFLGPSFVGMYFPEFSSFLFPAQSLGNLQFLSQIGLILFMFIIGMELDLKVLKNKAREAIIISHASIVFPFALGIILSYYMYCFYLTVSNKISNTPALKKPLGGFGKQSFQKRLDIIYGRHYKLDQFVEGDVYIAQLKINLLEHKAEMLTVG